MGNIFAVLLLALRPSVQPPAPDSPLTQASSPAVMSLETASPTVIKIEIPPPTSHRDRLPIMNPELILYTLDKIPYCRARAWPGG